MAALDFPDNPTNGQVYDKWTWNGTMWVLTASGGGGGGSGFTFSQDTTPTATKVGDTWFETDTGDSFVWTNDGNSTQWVQFAPGSGGGGGSGFTYVTDTTPTPSKVGDTWFDLSTAASGGTSWVAVSAVPGASTPLKWVQFAPGTAAGQKGYWGWGVQMASHPAIAAGAVTTIRFAEPVAGNIVYEGPAIGTLAWVLPRAGTYNIWFSLQAVSGIDRARITLMGSTSYDSAAVGGIGTISVMRRFAAGSKLQFQTYSTGAGALTSAHCEIRELGPLDDGLSI